VKGAKCKRACQHQEQGVDGGKKGVGIEADCDSSRTIRGKGLIAGNSRIERKKKNAALTNCRQKNKKKERQKPLVSKKTCDILTAGKKERGRSSGC